MNEFDVVGIWKLIVWMMYDVFCIMRWGKVYNVGLMWNMLNGVGCKYWWNVMI